MAVSKKSKYVKLSQIEHVLIRPDTYVGSINNEEKELYVVEDVTLKNINYFLNLELTITLLL